jgi:hypothetical protein
MAREHPAASVQEARARVDHVVVVMFENRSFDHLLGYLDHPFPDEYPGIKDVPNPCDVDEPDGETVSVSPCARHLLEEDPPHGHKSAKLQLHGKGWRHFRMDGFVTAYLRKLAGKECVPIVHWGRIQRALLILSVPLGVGLQQLVQIAGGEWSSSILLWFLIWFILAAGWQTITRIDRLLGRSHRLVLAAIFAAAALLAGTSEGITRLVRDPGWGAVPWCLVTAIGSLLLTRYLKRKVARKAHVPEAEHRQQSAKIMRCMHPDLLPVLATLAREFAVCINWHSSVPGATWPNRNFMHAASSEEAVDIEAGFYLDDTVFERLGAGNWRIYHHGFPQLTAFPRIWEPQHKDSWRTIDELFRDLAHPCGPQDHDCLPKYTFIEPRHSGDRSNSQHPGNNITRTDDGTDFQRGEDLLRQIYDVLRENKILFDRTVLVITYDEHGGFFDHVPPPSTVPPRRLRSRRPRSLSRRLISYFIQVKNNPFNFRVLGPRVPTVIVSPYIPRGRVDDTLYDHTSVIATLNQLFGSFPPLSRRDAHARSFHHLLGLAAARSAPELPLPVEPGPSLTEEPGEHVPRAAAPTDFPDRGAQQDDDLVDQLLTLAPKIDERLDRLGVPVVKRMGAPTAAEQLAETAERFIIYTSER